MLKLYTFCGYGPHPSAGQTTFAGEPPTHVLLQNASGAVIALSPLPPLKPTAPTEERVPAPAAAPAAAAAVTATGAAFAELPAHVAVKYLLSSSSSEWSSSSSSNSSSDVDEDGSAAAPPAAADTEPPVEDATPPAAYANWSFGWLDPARAPLHGAVLELQRAYWQAAALQAMLQPVTAENALPADAEVATASDLPATAFVRDRLVPAPLRRLVLIGYDESGAAYLQPLAPTPAWLRERALPSPPPAAGPRPPAMGPADECGYDCFVVLPAVACASCPRLGGFTDVTDSFPTRGVCVSQSPSAEETEETERGGDAEEGVYTRAPVLPNSAAVARASGWDELPPLPAAYESPLLRVDLVRAQFGVEPSGVYFLKRLGRTVRCVGVYAHVLWVLEEQAAAPATSPRFHGAMPLPQCTSARALVERYGLCDPVTLLRQPLPRGTQLVGPPPGYVLRVPQSLVPPPRASTTTAPPPPPPSSAAPRKAFVGPPPPPPPSAPARMLPQGAKLAPPPPPPPPRPSAAEATRPLCARSGTKAIVPGAFGAVLECDTQPSVLGERFGVAHGDRLQERRRAAGEAGGECSHGARPPRVAAVVGVCAGRLVVLFDGEPRATVLRDVNGAADLATHFMKCAGDGEPPLPAAAPEMASAAAEAGRPLAPGATGDTALAAGAPLTRSDSQTPLPEAPASSASAPEEQTSPSTGATPPPGKDAAEETSAASVGEAIERAAAGELPDDDEDKPDGGAGAAEQAPSKRDNVEEEVEEEQKDEDDDDEEEEEEEEIVEFDDTAEAAFDREQDAKDQAQEAQEREREETARSVADEPLHADADASPAEESHGGEVAAGDSEGGGIHDDEAPPGSVPLSTMSLEEEENVAYTVALPAAPSDAAAAAAARASSSRTPSAALSAHADPSPATTATAAAAAASDAIVIDYSRSNPSLAPTSLARDGSTATTPMDERLSARAAGLVVDGGSVAEVEAPTTGADVRSGGSSVAVDHTPSPAMSRGSSPATTGGETGKREQTRPAAHAPPVGVASAAPLSAPAPLPAPAHNGRALSYSTDSTSPSVIIPTASMERPRVVYLHESEDSSGVDPSHPLGGQRGQPALHGRDARDDDDATPSILDSISFQRPSPSTSQPAACPPSTLQSFAEKQHFWAMQQQQQQQPLSALPRPTPHPRGAPAPAASSSDPRGAPAGGGFTRFLKAYSLYQQSKERRATAEPVDVTIDYLQSFYWTNSASRVVAARQAWGRCRRLWDALQRGTGRNRTGRGDDDRGRVSAAMATVLSSAHVNPRYESFDALCVDEMAEFLRACEEVLTVA